MINHNAPAFPVPLLKGETLGGRGGSLDPNGITTRAHFAAMAMQGMVANHSLMTHRAEIYKQIATHAILYADALISQLNKEEKQ